MVGKKPYTFFQRISFHCSYGEERPIGYREGLRPVSLPQLIGLRVDPPELAQSDSLSWKLEVEHELPVTSERLWELLAVAVSCSEHRKSQI